MKPINFVSVGVAVTAGVATLILLFVPGVSDLLTFNNQNGLTILLGWITFLAAAALLVGIGNLLSVHLRKASALNLNSLYSLVFLLTFLAIIFMWGLNAIASTFIPAGTANTARESLALYSNNVVTFAFKYIQSPIEASLSAVLAVVLVLAGARLIRTRRHWSAILFILVALFLIVGLAPIGGFNFLGDLREGFNQYISVGATRGILLGISLGVIATGLRVIAGLDQPYGE